MTDKTLRIQMTIDTTPDVVFDALTQTDALNGWLSSQAEVSLEEQHYAFWGKEIPDNPDKTQGTNPITRYETDRLLEFSWQVKDGIDTIVTIKLLPKDNTTVLTLLQTRVATGSYHSAISNMEDFWFLSLENLRRYLDGKPCDARVDYSKPLTGDVVWSTDIDADIDTVFDVLTKPEKLNRWIASDASVNLKVGGELSYGWKGVPPFKIVELEPGRKIAHDWAEANEKGEIQTTIVTWTLEENNGKTRLTLVQSGFADDENTAGIQVGWRNFVNSIRSVAEYGDNWRPPTIKINNDALISYYADSVGEAQSEFITED